MKSSLILLFFHIFSAVLAAPFIGVKDTTAKLERFLATPFCKTYGCIFQARVLDNAVLEVYKYDFGLGRLDGAAVQVETVAGEVIGLEANFPNRKALGARDLEAMRALVELAAGRKIDYPYARNCTQNEPGKPQDSGKVAGFLFQVNCYRFPGTVDGAWEYNLKAWLPG